MHKRLKEITDSLPDAEQKSLLDFAEFLLSRVSESSAETDEAVKQESIPQPVPENENVINAIKRMRATYPMLNTDMLLNETSSLMSQFMVQGRDRKEVITDLEVLFEEHYQLYLNS